MKNWIQTYTGKKVDPTAMKASDVCIEDIAHALALKSRYTGQCPHFYSIAQHSVHVAQICPLKLQGLLHDAHEAYLADLSGPLKQSLRESGMTFWDDLEDSVDQAVMEHFGIKDLHNAAVKLADRILLVTEAYSFFGGTKTYKDWPLKDELKLTPAAITCWSWQTAEAGFLKAFEELIR